MCGIAGWIDWERDLSAERPTIERMTDTLRRRGPDDAGVWLSPDAALGHRRLSIIDPAHGQQPMIYEDDSRKVVLVYNGELYNFRELRAELESRGHRFRTRCDTEVVLHACLEWGADAVQRFDGIFAFALWDDARRTLLLARDRLGVKPLFFARRGSSIVFGSEIKALLAHPQIAPEVDADGLGEVLVAAPPGFAPTPGQTPYRGIHEVRPGHHVTAARDGGFADETYWRLTSRPHVDEAKATVERVRELLVGAVERQLVSDVPLASLLSGGLDSSGVTAIAKRALGQAPLQSWCIDFVDAQRDFVVSPGLPNRDAPFAAEAAEFIGTEHHPVVLDAPEMVDALIDCMRARDLPISHQHDSSLLLLFRAFKSGATVALSGEGSDEIFGGYGWFWQQYPGGPSFPWLFAEYDFRLSEDAKAKVKPNEYLERRYQEARAEVPRLPGESEVNATFRERVYLNMTRFLGYLLARKDRLGMYASVEGRVPFCDHKLVEYMWNVHPELQRIDDVEKTMLRRALEGYLPDPVRLRKKSVFPFFEHKAYVESMRARARDVLADRSSPVRPIFDAQYIENLTKGILPKGVELPPSATVRPLERFVQMDAWLREYRIQLV